MKPVDVKDNTYIGFKKEVNDKKYLLLRKLKILYYGHMFLMTLMVKKLLVPFMKMNCKRLIKKNLE